MHSVTARAPAQLVGHTRPAPAAASIANVQHASIIRCQRQRGAQSAREGLQQTPRCAAVRVSAASGESTAMTYSSDYSAIATHQVYSAASGAALALTDVLPPAGRFGGSLFHGEGYPIDNQVINPLGSTARLYPDNFPHHRRRRRPSLRLAGGRDCTSGVLQISKLLLIKRGTCPTMQAAPASCA